MKDDKGLYYYPYPDNKRVRMYVKQEGEEICFRLYSADDAKLWDDHGWVPYGAVLKAMEMYKGERFDPRAAYDINVAKMLIKENR